MIRTFPFLFFISFILVGCSSTSELSNSSTEDKKSKGLTYLALGDSYTIGEMVREEDNFPFQLVENLRANEIEIQNPVIIAKTGWRTDELIEAISLKVEKSEKYDLVSLLIGVNNQYQGKDFNLFIDEFQILLNEAISHSKNGTKGVFVFSIPDYSVMPMMIGGDVKKIEEEIKRYNQTILKITKEYAVKFYNITPISRLAQNQDGLIANDKLHPSGLMYQMWIKQYLKDIKANHL